MTGMTQTPLTVAVPFKFRDIAIHTWTTLAVFMLFVVGFSCVMALQNAPFAPVHSWLGTAVYSTGVIGISALILVWVFAPVAWLLGAMLRNITSMPIHALVFGAAGGSIGALIAAGLLINGPVAQVPAPAALGVGFVCGFCTAVGRMVAYRRRQVAEAKALTQAAASDR
jgi:uncharacterized protein YacL